MQQVGAKNKDGDGSKRKNRSPSATGLPATVNGESPTSDYHSQNGGGGGGGVASAPSSSVVTGSVVSHFTAVEDFVASEDGYLNGVFDLMAQVPGLLGKGVLAKTGGKKSTVTRAGRVRMSEYYHDHLWQTVGPALEKLLLWGGELPGGLLFLPYGLQHPRASLGLSSMLKDHLYAKFGDGYPPVVFPCVQVRVYLVARFTDGVKFSKAKKADKEVEIYSVSL